MIKPKGARRVAPGSALPEHPVSTSQAALAAQLDLNAWPNVKRGAWHPSLAPVAYKFMLLGLTEAEIAEHFGVTPECFSRWKLRHPELGTAVLLGGDPADTDVVVKLRECAMGYSHPEEKVFCTKDGDVVTYQTVKHYPPNPVAAMMYLSNRQRSRWKNATSLDHTSSDGSFSMFVAALRTRDAALEGEFKAIANDEDPDADGPVRGGG